MKTLSIALCCLFVLPLFSQYTLEGIVVDEKQNALPFINITIQNKDRTLGAASLFDGSYRIQNVPKGVYELKVSGLAFKTILTKNFKVSSNRTDTFELKKSLQKIEEVVIRRSNKFSTELSAKSIKTIPPAPPEIALYYEIEESAEYLTIAPPSDFAPIPDTHPKEEDKTRNFTLCQDENTSTFSIDVDNASYSHIRNQLFHQKIPDSTNVRIEEMLNYFNYNYPKPNENKLFSVYSELGDCPWNKSSKLLHIGLQGKSLDFENLDPSNLVFLIDVSGSMRASLSLIKKSLNMLVDELSEKDKIAIVVYAGAAGEILSATSAKEKATIKAAINNLEAGGSTAGGAGINLAYAIAKKNFVTKANNRVILCTDGDFNVGISSREGLRQLIEEKRKEKIFLSVCGFGYAQHRDREMETLADKGNGNYYYIDTEKEAQRVFVQQMRATLFTIAKDFKIQMVFDTDVVKAYRLIGYQNRRLANKDFKNDKKDAGELGAGQNVTALYEIIFQAPSEKENLATIKLRYKDPDKSHSKFSQFPLANKLVAQNNLSNRFQFSAAVASFGLLLKNTATPTPISISAIQATAQKASLPNNQESQKEFLKMLGIYAKLTK